MSENTKLDSKPILLMLALFLLAALGLTAYAWPHIPADARIATHWGVDGKANGYSSKTFGLLFLPIFTAAIVGFIMLVVRLDPRRAHVAQSQHFLNVVVGGILAVMCGIHAAMVGIALGYHVPLNTVVMVLVGGLFALIGKYMGGTQSNFVMGVRTPWTLSSELSWQKTHRLAGKLFMASGIVTMLAALLLPAPFVVGIMLVATFAASIVPIVYSYFVWKSDPARNGAHGASV